MKIKCPRFSDIRTGIYIGVMFSFYALIVFGILSIVLQQDGRQFISTLAVEWTEIFFDLIENLKSYASTGELP